MLKSIIFIVATAVMGSLSGCDIVNAIRMKQSNSDIEPVWAEKQRIKLKSVFLGEKPYIYANVQGEELLFLLDTGASFFVLHDTPKVRKLNLNRTFEFSVGGWGDEERSKAYQSHIERIDLGGVYFDNVKAAVIPTSRSRYYLRDDEAIEDGVIGHDMMRHFTWEIDAAHNDIYISWDKYQPENKAQYLKLDEFFGKIRVKGDLAFNEEHITNGEFIVDTGSRHYVKLSASYPENKEINIASSRVRAADFGLSGKVEHDRVTLPSLTFGRIKLDNVKVNLIPGGDEDDWWIIGNALMNQFKTVIDYKSEAFYLVPQQEYVTNYNLLGLELRKIRSGEFVVRYLFPELPASELGIKVGDLVTKINTKSAHDISLSDYNNIASQADKHQLCIQRDNLCFDVEAKHIDGYSNL